MLNCDGEQVFSKGHVEDGEYFIDTAIREVKEEASVVLSRNDCLGQIDEFRFYFACENAINKDEGFIEGKWFDLDDGIKKPSHNDARESLEKGLLKLGVQVFYEV